MATAPAAAVHYANPAAAVHYGNPAAAAHYGNPAAARSSSPAMPPEPAALFCSSCQRNQLLLNKTLAEYLPDEDDPDYAQYLASLDAYRSELEDRYPQVCARCLPRVQDQIRAAGYAAKADHLRRMMDRSREHSRTAHTSRQAWTLRAIALAKCVYIGSVLVGLLWHAMGLTMASYDRIDMDEDVSWRTCLAQAFSVHRASQSCVMSAYGLDVLQGSLVADWLTVWWNPKLASKTNTIAGRMRGLKALWSIRTLVLLLRTATFVHWKLAPVHSWTVRVFHNTNLVLLVAMTLSFALTWRTVRIVYTPVALPEETYVPSAPSTPQRPKSSYKPARPHMSTFDTMAQGFTSSFAVDSANALPPSPTLTEASTASRYTEFTTPARKSVYQDDTMDWTPTARRFAPSAADILPPQFGSRSAAPPRSPEPVSLFAKPDPNPFRHKVPAAPRAPAHARADPWKRAPWQPPLQDTLPNFFQSSTAGKAGRVSSTGKTGSGDQASDKGESETETEDGGTGLEGLGVPRNVQRDADLFATPKLKYDYYGTMKDTGLEDTFNSLFSK
ncbi:uncharacterized protein M421DRAFT_420445 [Didymella exigua CBS 183.55]|uniref:Ima1 N-terminal domain-containing protein n=1 Tax=Didymella exigua CBS 183.55 TaxID=1150837 RepID=A0A6A5RN51_9PLEO|nr:uncharacterized protein M421DRAFT_420445 [Didymella exigua CBS 183.55]KAF1928558.1 hypothetical protein M421DRAFT_420445 [Didymella exigua CBS 183.55]